MHDFSKDAMVEAKEQSVNDLVDEISRLRRRIFELEEENDLLAVENQRLRAVTQATQAVAPPAPPTASQSGEAHGIFGSWDEHSYLRGDTGEKYASEESVVVEGAGSGLNPLCCRLVTARGMRLGFVAGVDKMISAFHLTPEGKSVPVGSLAGFEAPVLSLDIRPTVAGEGEEPALVLLATCMDGVHAIVHVNVEDGGMLKMDIVHRAKDHAKFVVVGRWAADGSMYATGSHDKSARLYRYTRQGEGQASSELVKEVFFSGNVEALCFVTPVDSATREPWLIISVRGLPHLAYLSCVEGERLDVSLNASEWDSHVSFTVLSLSPSPCHRYILAATDKSRLIIYRTGTNQILRNLYGHQGDEFSSPRAVWHPSGKHVSCSSLQPHQVVTWAVSSERVVGHLKGHTSTIRDVYCDPLTGQLASVAYDKTMRVYAQPGQEEEYKGTA